MIEEQDIPKYRKKKNTSSKSKAKSKHKHIYKECLIRIPNSKNTSTYLCSYCIICGKIGEPLKESIVENMNRNINYFLSSDKIYEKYKDKMETFIVDSYFSKYVKLKEDNDG